MNNAKKLKAYDAAVEKVTASIKALEDVRSEIWQKRDALFCKCLER